jgi:hypothetical protein
VSAGTKLATEAGAEAQLQGNPTEARRLAKWDIIGMVIGLPVFLLAICALTGLQGIWWVGATVLFVSVSLFIPSRLYDHGRVRTIGSAAVSLAIAVSVNCAFVFGFGVCSFCSDPGDEYALGFLVMIGGGGLIAFAVALLCACVLLKKLRPSPIRAGITATAGIVLGLLNMLAVYLLLSFD